MKAIPYYILSALWLLVCVIAGGALASGSEYIKEQAKLEGISSVLISMELKQLGKVDTHDL